MSDQPLTLELVQVLPPETSLQPAAPLNVASTSFINTLKLVEAEVRDITVNDDATSQLAANLLIRLTGAGSGLEKQRVALKAPYLEFGKRIDDAANPIAARIEYLKTLIGTKNHIYIQDKRVMAERTERLRLKELAELKKKQEQEAAEALRLKAEEEAKWAAEAAARVPAMGIDLGEDEEPAPEPEVVKPTPTEERIAALQAAPAVRVVAPSGVRETVTLVFKVVDVNKLADVFVDKTPRTAALRAAYCQGYKDGMPLPVVAGLEFEVQRSIQSTGRSAF